VFTIISFTIALTGLIFFMSGFARMAVCGIVLLGGGFAAMAATKSNVGVAGFEHKEGISLRQDSTNSHRGFFLMYGSRSHRGGGLAGGK
jgi:hypothetical protein